MGIKRTASGRIYYDADDQRQTEVVGLLGQLGERLKRSESEREELWRELQEYRKSLSDLEDKNAKSEKAYFSLQTKISQYEKLEAEILKRQQAFEKAHKEQAQKESKPAAPAPELLKRIADTEARARLLAEKLEETLAEQKKLDRRLEKTVQDKMRMQRRIDHFEEVITETQDAIRSKALVVLTDQAMAPQGPLLLEDKREDGALAGPWWNRPVRLHVGVVGTMMLAALLGGWFISDVTRLALPQVAVLDGASLAALGAAGQAKDPWQPIVVDGRPVAASESPQDEALAAPPEDTASAMGPVDYQDDEKLIVTLPENPDALAAQLNDIAPSPGDTAGLDAPPAPEAAGTAQDLKQEAALPPEPQAAPAEEKPLAPEPAGAQEIEPITPAASASAAVIGKEPDPALPDMVKEIEKKAFQGVPEAQHDLAAVYTAGHGGVKQDYDRAAFWFRKAADQGIANAAYNLGVLSHQGFGVKKSMPEAIKWYTQAADMDHPEAQYNLGIAYIEGIGVTYDPKKAADYFEKAASRGIVEAAYNLGLIHENGLLGQAKPEEAILWYKTAADWGSPEARAALTQLSKNLGIDPAEVDRIVGRMARPEKPGQPEGNQDRKAETSTQPLRARDLSTVDVRSEALDQVVVAQIQKQLLDMGLYPGPADGRFGPVTEDAIRTYESQHDLSVTGRPSESLLVHMLARSTASDIEQGDTDRDSQ